MPRVVPRNLYRSLRITQWRMPVKGSIRELGPNKWQLRVDAGDDPDTGRRRQIGRTYIGKKRGAQDALRDLLSETEAAVVTSRATTVGIAVQSWYDRSFRKWKTTTA